jgi:hypothetical protein
VEVPEFEELVRSGVANVYAAVGSDLPLNADRLQAWMRDLAGTLDPADYFLHPAAFPTLLLPWWVEAQLRGDHDPAFQTDLIFSNAILYYYTRLVDNVMDGHATVETKLLPATGYCVVRGHDAYRSWFASDHPFWDFFAATWSEFADVTAADGHSTATDERLFLEVASRKVCASKISVAAVCFRYHQPDALAQWSEWIDLFGRWHLFQEDLFDWQQDLTLGVPTFFLSEAARRKHPGEPEISWVAREGLEWGLERLAAWMRELRQLTFVPEPVSAYLDMREKRLYAQRERVSSALETIRKLSGV